MPNRGGGGPQPLSYVQAHRERDAGQRHRGESSGLQQLDLHGSNLAPFGYRRVKTWDLGKAVWDTFPPERH